MPKLVEVTQPLAVIRHSKYVTTAIYLLPDEKHWFQAPAGKRVGPCLLVREEAPNHDKVFKRSLADPDTWGWMESLLNVGQWALNDKRTAPYLPDQYIQLSPRFAGTSLEQRRKMRDRLPFFYRRRRHRPKTKK